MRTVITADMDQMSVLTRVIDALVVRLCSQAGQTMTEYAILITWLALLVIVAAGHLGSAITHLFSSSATKI